jgi:hypothetical protein
MSLIAAEQRVAALRDIGHLERDRSSPEPSFSASRLAGFRKYLARFWNEKHWTARILVILTFDTF